MNEVNSKSIVKRLAREIRDSTDHPQHQAEIFRALGLALGLPHHLRPSCVADILDMPALPKSAPELYRNREDPSEGIAAFLRRVYQTWLGKGMTRSHLNDLDSAAYTAYKNLLYYHGDGAGIDLPTKGEQIDLDFAKLTAVNDPASRQALEGEIVALRRIHHLLESRSPKDDTLEI